MDMNSSNSANQMLAYQRPASAASSMGVRIPMADPGTTFNPQDRNMYEAFAVRRDGSQVPQSLAAYNLGSSTAKPPVNPPIQSIGG